MWAVIREALVSSWADRAFFMAVAVTAMLCSTVASGTTGQTAAAEQAVVARIDSASSRVVVVSDRTLEQLMPQHVDLLAAISDVEWAIGFGIAEEGSNAALPGSDAVAVRRWLGTPPPAVATSWTTRPGTALASPGALRTLGLTRFGAVRTSDWTSTPIVGQLDVPESLAFLDGTVVVAAEPDPSMALRSVHLGATTPEAAAAIADLVGLIVQPPQADQLVIEAPEVLGQLRQAVVGELGRFGRDLLVLVSVVGALLIAATLSAKAVLRQRQIGRRRALGATRSTVVLIVVVEGLLPATSGAAAGGIATAALGAGGVISPVPASFQAGVFLLVAATSVFASLVPSCVAAFKDPVAVLRQP